MTIAESNAMLAVNIMNAIKAHGMKNTAVAERAGFSAQKFSDMLNGRKIIKPCDILAISKALDVDVADLFAEPDSLTHKKGGNTVYIDFSNVATRDLVEELKKREGVKTTIAEPYQDVRIEVNGPAIVLVVID